MGLPEKEVTCDHCGHTFLSDKYKYWCDKCGRPVFYDAEGRRKNKVTNLIITLAVVGVFCFVTYIFIEMIVEPLMR
jgi:hypothetical protein